MPSATAVFEWDDGNRAKCEKHGVSIAEIEAFLSGGPRVAPDAKHSVVEKRFLAVGRNPAGRPMFVVFTVRMTDGHERVRPISARYMHAEEIEGYEAESPDV